MHDLIRIPRNITTDNTGRFPYLWKSMFIRATLSGK